MGFSKNQKACGICKATFVSHGHSLYGLTPHLKKNHSEISLESYYTAYICKRDYCLTCGSGVKFKGLSKGYAKFCSIGCSNIHSFEFDKDRRKKAVKWGKKNGANQIPRLVKRNKTIEARMRSSLTSKANWKNSETRLKMKGNGKHGSKNLMKFNSNPANRLHMNGLFGVIAEYKNTGVVMRSNLERAFATMLDDFEIPWEYEPETFKLVKGNQIQYTPDFLVEGVYVEIKMKKHQTDTVRSVLSDVKKQHGKKVVLLDKDDFFQFCCKIIK